jgi:competence ComEA-like helix-hairpin-helix protein
MTRDESRTLAITAAVLFLAGAARAGLEAVRPPLALEADTVSTHALAADSQEMVDEDERRSAPLAPGERLDPNTASEEELDRLPGIGPAAARAIVESRGAEGPFADVGALTRVRGIGPATVERLAPLLTLESGGGGRAGRAAATTPPATRSAALSADSRAAGPIDLNRATAGELEQVRGIGPALAARIIARRNEVGGFGRVEDLIEVRGIGPATLESMRGSFFVRR